MINVQKMIGRILNYIDLETVKVGEENLKMVRSEGLKKKIVELFTTWEAEEKMKVE